MIKKKFQPLFRSKSLFEAIRYGLGEILLVSVGILLAIYVNSLIDDNKNENQRMLLTQEILNECTQALNEIDKNIKRIDERAEQLRGLLTTVYDDNSTIDTLIRVIQEFPIYIQTATILTPTTFESVVQSSNINLFEPEVIKELIGLYKSFEVKKEYTISNRNEYVSYQLQFANKYYLDFSGMYKDKAKNKRFLKLAKDMDIDQAFHAYSALIELKLIILNGYVRQYESLENEIRILNGLLIKSL